MTTKLVSANMGIVLIVEKDGKQEKVEFSTAIPNIETQHPLNLVEHLLEFLNESFGTGAIFNWVEFPEIKVAKPKRIKAKRPISHDEFNQKIKALVP